MKSKSIRLSGNQLNGFNAAIKSGGDVHGELQRAASMAGGVYEPRGTKFFSVSRNQEMILCSEGPWKDWILYKHPDGQWVSLRQATESDVAELANAASKAHHE